MKNYYWVEIRDKKVYALWDTTSESPPVIEGDPLFCLISEPEYRLLQIAQKYYGGDLKKLRKASLETERFIRDVSILDK